jgi:bacterioferritin
MSNKKIIQGLNDALEREMSNVVSYLHYSFMVRGVNRGPLVEFFRGQAQESFGHATRLGEKIVALGGQPSIRVEPIRELKSGTAEAMLREELGREKEEVMRYIALLKLVENDIALRVMLEEIVKDEQEGIEELERRVG